MLNVKAEIVHYCSEEALELMKLILELMGIWKCIGEELKEIVIYWEDVKTFEISIMVSECELITQRTLPFCNFVESWWEIELYSVGRKKTETINSDSFFFIASSRN